TADRAARRQQDRDTRRQKPERRHLGRHAARVGAQEVRVDLIARLGAQEHEGRRRRRGRDDRRDPEPPTGILAVPSIARRDEEDGRCDERRARRDHDLCRGEAAVIDEMRSERDAEERDRHVAQLARAVRCERGDRDDREQQHQRTAQTRSVAMSVRASHTPARSSKAANTPDTVVADPASARNDADAMGTGSAAETTASSRVLNAVSSGSRTRTARATTTSSVATTAMTGTSVTRSSRLRVFGLPIASDIASRSGNVSARTTMIVPRNETIDAETSRSAGTAAMLRRRPACASSRPTTAPAAITARTAVRRSDVSNAPITIVIAPATITVELAIAVMYERRGGIQNASVTAARPPPASTTNAPAR